jgi:hypothetical protein
MIKARYPSFQPKGAPIWAFTTADKGPSTESEDYTLTIIFQGVKTYE